MNTPPRSPMPRREFIDPPDDLLLIAAVMVTATVSFALGYATGRVLS